VLAGEEAEVQEPILPIVQICDGLEQHRGLALTLKELHDGQKLLRLSALFLPPRCSSSVRVRPRHVEKDSKNH
jgi:hypothetical protein